MPSDICSAGRRTRRSRTRQQRTAAIVDVIDLASATAHGESANYSWRDERAANDFAAELLMPASLVIGAAREEPSVQVLARASEVSREAMGFRLINLGLK